MPRDEEMMATEGTVACVMNVEANQPVCEPLANQSVGGLVDGLPVDGLVNTGSVQQGGTRLTALELVNLPAGDRAMWLQQLQRLQDEKKATLVGEGQMDQDDPASMTALLVHSSGLAPDMLMQQMLAPLSLGTTLRLKWSMALDSKSLLTLQRLLPSTARRRHIYDSLR